MPVPLGTLFAPRRRTEQARLAHALRGVPLFQSVPQDDLVAIWDRLSAVAAPTGSVLCRQGDSGDRFYMVYFQEPGVAEAVDRAAAVVRG